jgi:hypothetical protein
MVRRHAAFAAGLARFLRSELVRSSFLVGCLAPLAGNFPLFGWVHAGKTTFLGGHGWLSFWKGMGINRPGLEALTEVSQTECLNCR